MMRSLFSGVSGMRNNQTRMDVSGNNIANVNTVGFKSGRVTFQDVLSQTTQGSSAPTGTRGGTNPKQIGLGVGIASIDTMFTDGSFQPTGKATDLSIQGPGFFVLGSGGNQYYTRAGNFDFDTEGNFGVPGTGYLVQGWTADTSGVIDSNAPIKGITIPVGQTIPAKATDSITNANNLSASAKIGDTAMATIDVYDSQGTAHTAKTTYTKVADNVWIASTSVSGIESTPTPTNMISEITFGTDGKLDVTTGIKSVPLLPTKTSVEASGLALNASAAIGTTYTKNFVVADGAGAPRNVLMTATKDAAANTWTIAYTSGGASVGGGKVDPTTGTDTVPDITFTNADGTTYSYDMGGIVANSAGGYVTQSILSNTTMTLDSAANTSASDVTFSHVFNVLDATSGKLVPVTMTAVKAAGSADWTVNYAGPLGTTVTGGGTVTTGTTTSGFNLNGASYTLKVDYASAANAVSATTITDSLMTTPSYTTSTNANMTFTPSGSVSPMSVSLNLTGLTQYGGDTSVQATTQSGYAAGTMNSQSIDVNGNVVGGFTNGQTRVLAKLALATFNNPAGLTKVGSSLFAKSTNSGEPQVGTTGVGGRGSINPGTLEMSNVDLAEEFSNMIITQRGFQANSRVITTTDTMLEELINLKR